MIMNIFETDDIYSSIPKRYKNIMCRIYDHNYKQTDPYDKIGINHHDFRLKILSFINLKDIKMYVTYRSKLYTISIYSNQSDICYRDDKWIIFSPSPDEHFWRPVLKYVDIPSCHLKDYEYLIKLLS